MWRGVASRRYRRFHPAWGSQDFGQIFGASLQSSLVPESAAGSNTPTFTRATTAYLQDWEGLWKAVLSGESRFVGARRVQNLVPNSGTLTAGAGWNTDNATSVIGQTDPDGGVTAYLLTATAIGGRLWNLDTAALGATHTTSSIWIKRVTGTGTVTLNAGNASTDISGALTTSWQRFSNNGTAVANSARLLLSLGTSGDAVAVWHPQAENVTGQSNPTPSEYVSVGVLSAPYHGAGVDGVKYFTTLNGNTVASNVVTEATGAAIVTGAAGVSASTVDAGGPFGYFAEGAGTQLVTPTASIRDMTDASWVKGATMTAALTGTGIDGVTNSCTRLTGGAVSATNTVFQTLTAAASSRTYSVWLKRVTGTGVINITQDGGVGYTDVTSQINSSTFTRVSLAASQLNAVFGIQVVTDTDVILADFNQFEAVVGTTGGSSQMAAAGAARNADVDQYVSASNVPTNNFTIYGESTFPILLGTKDSYLFGTYVDANNSTQVLFDGTNLIARRRIAGASNDAAIALSPTAKTVFKWAARFSSTSGTDIFLNGTKGTNDSVATACQIGTNFQFGADGNGANQSYATDRAKRVYSRALTDAQLQVMTT